MRVRILLLNGLERVFFFVVDVAYQSKAFYDFLLFIPFLFTEGRKVGIIIPEFHIYYRKQ